MGDEKLLKEIGARISKRRRELSITQELLAEKMEVSVQMISNLELGKKAVRPENLLKLCRALGVSADYVLQGIRSEKENSEFLESYARLSDEKKRIIDALIQTWK